MNIRPLGIDLLPPAVLDYITQLEAQIASQAAELAHSRKIFERASVAAKIGVWECRLEDERLSWSDGVYDIFELPRGSLVTRAQILAFYPEDSRSEVIAIRNRAIEERSGFTLEIEIVTARGRRRWIRLTATIECHNDVAVRIFGIKQDITEERNLLNRTRYLAEFDVLTGLANRSQFQARLSRLNVREPEHLPVSALLLIDLDKFKQINDAFGHVIGDQCLMETANRLRAACPDADLIARIGGDEFAVLLGPGLDANAVKTVGKLIVESFSETNTTFGPLLQLGVSVGIAYFVCQTAEDLFLQADVALYAAKDAGRQTVRAFENGIETRFSLPRSAA